MRRLQRPPCPDVLATRGAEQTRALCALYDSSPPHRQGQANFPFRSKTWSSLPLRRALERAQDNKCAYCDAVMPPLEVEHYRPKSASQRARGEPAQRPGYYWLAYTWENLLLCCVLCNQPRRDTADEQTGKGMLFPLAQEEDRARSHHDDLAREKPLLLNPYEDDPDQHISYRQYIPVPRSERGKATIEVLKLCGKDQLARPRSTYEDLEARVIEFFDRVEGGLEPDQEQQGIETLWAYAHDSAEYAAMARAALAGWGLPPP